MDKKIPIIDAIADSKKNKYKPYADKNYVYIPIGVTGLPEQVVYYKIPKKLFKD